MPFSLYEISVPVFIRNLKVLQQLLEKGQAHAAGKEAALTESRLIADMYPLTFQVQSACDTAKFHVVRVCGIENVVMEDKEKTFPELQERIAKTIALLEAVKPDSMDGKEIQEVKGIKRNGVVVPLNGKQYTLEFSVPNFFFHVAMTYALLRKEGVDVGKNDFLGAYL
jgi:hypothetical protein